MVKKIEQDGRNIQVLTLKKNVSIARAINNLKKRSEVEFVEPNYIYKTTSTPNDPNFSVQWGLHNSGQIIKSITGISDADIDAPEAWDIETGNTTPVTVAVIDSGIDTTHPDLSSKIWQNTDEIADNSIDDDGNGYIDDVNGYNFAGISQYSNNGSWTFGGGTYSSFAQSITGTDQKLTNIGIGLRKIGSPSENITVALRSTIDGSNLATATITPAEVATSAAEIYKTLSSQVTLNSGTIYYIVILTANSNVSNYYRIYSNIYGLSNYESDPYRGGNAYRYASSWTTDSSDDLYFHTNPNPLPLDDNGHGTHVSGIIGAATNNGVGIAGVSHKAKIMALKAGDSTGSLSTADIIAAINYATNNGAKIINMSFGGTGYSALTQQAITNAYNAGVLMCASSGNTYDTTIEYPAGYTNVIGVGATTNKDQKATFSTYNSSVDVSAPGQYIYATLPTYAVAMNSAGYAQNYDYLSGTSMASPMAAGVAALIRSKYPSYTVAQIENLIIQNTDDLGTSGRDNSFGYGRVNVFKALANDSSAPSAPSITSSTHPSSTKYYSNNNPTFSWSATDATGIGGYSYVLDSSSSTTPDTISEGSLTSIGFSNIGNGTHYFHVIATDIFNYWSQPTHYQLKVDTYKPRTYARGAHAKRPSIRKAKRCLYYYKLYKKKSQKTRKRKLRKRYKKLAKKYFKLYRKAKKRIATAKLRWKVSDPYTGNKANVTFKVQIRKHSKTRAKRRLRYRNLYKKYRRLYKKTRNRRLKKRYKKRYKKYLKAYRKTKSIYYKTIKTVSLKSANINGWRKANFKTSKVGSYRFLVYAKDRAGNNQYNIAKGAIKIK